MVSWGRIQRKTWCLGPYAAVAYNLTLCPLESRLQHIYHGQPLPESTLTYARVNFGFGLWCVICMGGWLDSNPDLIFSLKQSEWYLRLRSVVCRRRSWWSQWQSSSPVPTRQLRHSLRNQWQLSHVCWFQKDKFDGGLNSLLAHVIHTVMSELIEPLSVKLNCAYVTHHVRVHEAWGSQAILSLHHKLRQSSWSQKQSTYHSLRHSWWS